MRIKQSCRLDEAIHNALVDYAAERCSGNTTQAMEELLLAGLNVVLVGQGKAVLTPVAKPRPTTAAGSAIDWDHIKREVERIRQGIPLTAEERDARYEGYRGIRPGETMEEFQERRMDEGYDITRPPGSMADFFARLTAAQLRKLTPDKAEVKEKG